MNELEKEKMLDLLIAQATNGLSADEASELQKLEKEFPELANDDSFELAAAGFSMANLDVSEPMPDALQAKILAGADKFFGAEKAETKEPEEFQKTFAFESPKRSVLQWLGWAFAAVACVALGINLWLTRSNPQIQTVYVQASPTPPTPMPQQREQILAASDAVQTKLANPKNPNEIVGDVVWSDSKQKGFVRLRGVPVNDKTKEQYQLWIVAANQNQKTPVDGGVFDVGENGEVIIPIDAKVKVQNPAAFVVTAEKPGGVVVSEGQKVMAIGKIQA
ncbi:MAG TPA: anti-sigma factor [Pyrinomonadaceae bacterium]|jgi:anti-sigma-K factor RskA